MADLADLKDVGEVLQKLIGLLFDGAGKSKPVEAAQRSSADSAVTMC